LRDESLYLADIRDCCIRVIGWCAGLESAQLFEDEMRRDAVLRNLELLGEAAKRVTIQTRERFIQIPWRSIAGFRDVLAHGYFQLDEDAVWDVISNEVPVLLGHIQDALAALEADP
jgi:uncharacterized protein with HEPN domain